MRKFSCQGARQHGIVAWRTSAGLRIWSVCVFSVLALLGCTGPVQRAEQLARRGRLEFLVLPGEEFQHRGFAAVRGHDLLVLFIDGDGSPWVDHGRRVAADPTPRVPLGLELAVRTPESVLYLGRPCYLGLIRDGCTEKIWTSERYSAAVVASMVAATKAYVVAHNFSRVLIVGYSGGGTLAVLMASQLFASAPMNSHAAASWRRSVSKW